MKIRKVELLHFKQFERYALDFTDPVTGLVKDLVVLVGANGAGKTSILQSIAACLGKATRAIDEPAQLDWPGFDLDLVGQAWGAEPEVKLEVEFGADELATTQDLFRRLATEQQAGLIAPSSEPIIHLTMRGNHVEGQTHAAYFQFRGHSYARQLIGKDCTLTPDVFKQVGTVFWYHDQRTATSILAAPSKEKAPNPKHRDELAPLRDQLIRLQAAHQAQTHRRRVRAIDYYGELERAYQQVFVNRMFIGPVPKAGIGSMTEELDFILSDGQKDYELKEMSGGEKAIFPILFDFANWSISRSVILIDELELHLSTPLQQALLLALNSLGQNNQFILTTHSPAIASIVPADALYHVDQSSGVTR